jgi:non-heme chloroperoxidase
MPAGWLEGAKMTAIADSAQLPNGVMLPYSERGDPSGAPVVLLHGFTDSLRSFDLVVPSLPPSIRAIALTQRGHGDADRPASGYRVTNYATDLLMFMDALSLEAAFIVGASSGGLVAQRFAADHPARVMGLVLIGSPVTLRGKPAVEELWRSTISRLGDPVDREFVRRFQGGTIASTVSPAFLETMVQESLKVPAHVWRATTEGFLEDDFSAEVHRIKAPTLILWGDRDVLTQADQEVLRAAIPDSRLVTYPGAGHTLIAEAPERVAVDLTSFVETVLAG